MSSKFFEERGDQSAVKARIIQKYFYAWANVIIPSAKRHGSKIAYIDLYAGPGRYKDGSASTPLLVLENAIENDNMREMLVALFNDADGDNTATLQSEIAKLPGIESLRHKPTVTCGPVDEEAADYFQRTKLIPSFTFVDPFGYKGLSLGIIRGVIKDWGCDCVFFFNYNRINAGIGNPAVTGHIDSLFGKSRADSLRALLPDKSPEMREALILEELSQAIKSMGGAFVLPFRFKNEKGTRTSHSLIFVSKNFLGYNIMKEIMAKESSVMDQGVPSLTYSPAEASMPLLFSLAQPLNALEEMLRGEYSGKSITMEEIFLKHSVDRRYIKKNYKEVLLDMEKNGVISVSSDKKRRPGTFADHLMVRFH